MDRGRTSRPAAALPPAGRRWAVLLALALLPTNCSGARPAAPPRPSPALGRLETGDLLFLDLNCELCQAIETVTREQLSPGGPSLSHVGLVQRMPDGALYLLEAWPDGGVVRTPLAQALARVKGGLGQPGGVEVFRLPARWRPVGRRAVERGLSLLGTPYDPHFLPENGKLYCSELVQLAFRAANGGKAVFRMRPMTFGRPGQPARATWERYFRRQGMPLPQGIPGASPLSILIDARNVLPRTAPAASRDQLPTSAPTR